MAHTREERTVDEKSQLELAMEDVQAKTADVADAKAAIGTVTDEANLARKAAIREAHERLNAAKSALEGSRKSFDRAIRAASKP